MDADMLPKRAANERFVRAENTNRKPIMDGVAEARTVTANAGRCTDTFAEADTRIYRTDPEGRQLARTVDVAIGRDANGRIDLQRIASFIGNLRDSFEHRAGT